jgi:cytidine deaminase
MTKKELCTLAVKATEKSYSPYSNCKVGAALLCKNGNVYLGCNIENASFSPTVCAERTAFFKAISEGEKDFEMIAVVGIKDGIINPNFLPCGVCRQVMTEFCESDFVILNVKEMDEYNEFTLSDLLPNGFSKQAI